MSDMRLIDANALPNYKFNVTIEVGEHKGPAEIRVAFWEDVKNAPTIDAVPVVHARWVYDRPQHYKCSVCKSMWGELMKRMARFCPNCGAKMDGGAADA